MEAEQVQRIAEMPASGLGDPNRAENKDAIGTPWHEGTVRDTSDTQQEMPNSIQLKAGETSQAEASEPPGGNTDQPTASAAVQIAEQSRVPSDDEISEELLLYLKEDSFTMDVTERQLRTRLEKHFCVPLKEKKAIIRDKIMEFIQAKQEQEDAKAALHGVASGQDDQFDEEEDEDEQPRKKKRGGGLNAGCSLSEPLQAFLGVETMSRPQVVKALWAYIRENNLQEPSNKRKIIVDEKLATIFTKPLDMFSMNRQLSKHVKTLEKSDMAEGDEGASGGSPKAKPVLKKKVAGRAMAATKRKKASRDDDEEDGEEGEDARPRKLNGFSKPLKVSPELSEWLGGEKQISRPQLVKRFWAYAKERGLMNPDNKKECICDEALKKLTGEERFVGFGFSKYMKRHLLGYADTE